MKINIACLKQPTFNAELSTSRINNQLVTDYLHQEIQQRIALIKKGVIDVCKEKDKQIPLFFVLPEFFWNVKWGVLKSKDEINQFTSYMMTFLSDAHEQLMRSLPENDFGKIILLGGSVAVLLEDTSTGIFEALNYCLISNNFSKTDDKRYAKSMWPKRTTSHIDFGLKDKITENGFIFTLSDGLTIEVLNSTKHVAEHDNSKGFGLNLDNTILTNCPFSINLCLDYGLLKPMERNTELQEPKSKIDFLIACGMPLDINYHYPDSVEFTVRNDGMGKGEVEYYSIKNNALNKRVKHKDVTSSISLVEFTVN